MKRVKPRREVKAATTPASREDYERLAKACVNAVINRQWDILFHCPYFIKFKDKTFPVKLIHAKTETTNIYRLKTRKLLDWLYKNGYSEFNTEHVMKGSRQLEYDLCAFDRSIDNLGE